MEWKKEKAFCTNRFLSVIVEINGKYYVTSVVYLSVRKQREKLHTAGHCYLSQREGKREGKKVYCSAFL
jgi:hypothetical protein